MKKATKILIIAGLLFLLTAPIFAIFILSNAEIRKYDQSPVPPLVEKAYGDIVPVERMDISESISVSGTFKSTKKFFMDLPKFDNPFGIRLLVETGDEIYKNQVIGYSADLKNEIRATDSGIILGITIGDTSYLTLESMENLALECFVDSATLSVLKRENLKLETENSEKVSVLSISKTQNEDDKTLVALSVPNGIYGQTVDDLKLKTGRVFNQALVVDSRCVFKLFNSDDKWYVRTVDSNGNFLNNIDVTISYFSKEYVAISGVPEGTLCDSGYYKIAENS